MQETVASSVLAIWGRPSPAACSTPDTGSASIIASASRAEALAAAGAEVAKTPAEAAPRGGVVFSIVADDDALKAICEGENGIPAGLGAGGVHVSMSTVGAVTAREMEERHEAAGAAYLCAPVFGRPPAAAAGELWVALSGPPDAKARARPPLAAFTAGVKDFGAAPGAASVVKLANNFLIGAAIEAAAEACALVEKHDVDRAAFVELITSSLFDCPVYRIYGEAGGGAPLRTRGLSASPSASRTSRWRSTRRRRARFPCPAASVVRDRLLSLADGRADQDWTALDAAVSAAAGLAAPSSAS